jgi:hypothetical protein
MSKTRKAVEQKDDRMVYDVEVVSPDYFSRQAIAAAEFVARAEAFYEAMDTLDRAVVLHYDPEVGGLYLSSIPKYLRDLHV